MRKGIIWLASYPKSGNTWTRAFFQAVLRGSVSINKLQGKIASGRNLVESCLGIDINELSHQEVRALRPLAYQQIYQDAVDDENDDPHFMKVHDAYGYVNEQQPLFPREVTSGVILIVRNPFDVAVSYANHASISIDQAVRLLCDTNFSFAKSLSDLDMQLEQKMGLWTDYVDSWLDSGMPTLLVRYEDMIADPRCAFSRMVEFTNIQKTPDEIERAVRMSNFRELSKQEQEEGFGEKAPGTERFFNKGQVGTWQQELSDKQIQRIIKFNRPNMLRLGYLEENGDFPALIKGQ